MINTLVKLGLSEKAAKIYLDLLQKGKSSVDQISQSTGISRTGIYPYIAELQKFDLVDWNSRTADGALSAKDPQVLAEIAQQKKQEINHLSQKTQQLIPDLQAMFSISDPTYTVHKFTGIKACRKALERVYNHPTQNGYCGEFVYEELDQKWYENHLQKMYQKHHINDRVIFSKKALKDLNYSQLKNTKWFNEKYAKYRVHPTIDFPQSMDVYILEDEVLTIFSEEKITCVIIKSQKYRDHQQAIFEALWQSSVDIKDYQLSKNT